MLSDKVITPLILLEGALLGGAFGTMAGIHHYRQTRKLWRSIEEGMTIGSFWLVGAGFLCFVYGFRGG